MLYLIQRNRLGKNIIHTEDTNINWREQFKSSEDALTSSVFALLFYLPVEMFWEILSKACYEPKFPTQTGKMNAYEFWPHWNSTDTENAIFVEPDVFIQFEEFDLIIEAKRYDHKAQQNPSQWESEITSYYNEYREQEKPLYFIALAGYLSTDHPPVKGVLISICKWNRILQQVKLVIKHIQSRV